jgi:hypothetical protein
MSSTESGVAGLEYAKLLTDLLYDAQRTKASLVLRLAMDGARAFLAVRSYLATARKQGQGMLEVLTAAFEGRPWLPAASGP